MLSFHKMWCSYPAPTVHTNIHSTQVHNLSCWRSELVCSEPHRLPRSCGDMLSELPVPCNPSPARRMGVVPGCRRCLKALSVGPAPHARHTAAVRRPPSAGQSDQTVNGQHKRARGVVIQHSTSYRCCASS